MIYEVWCICYTANWGGKVAEFKNEEDALAFVELKNNTCPDPDFEWVMCI